MNQRIRLQEPALSLTIERNIRFSEIDSTQVVWHGSYVAYLEDGREQFGLKYKGLGYADYFAAGYITPVVNLNIDYKQSLRSGDCVVIETRYIAQLAAKIVFQYVIYRKSDMAMMATAQTTQVFVNLAGEMQYEAPTFYLQWKERWLK